MTYYWYFDNGIFTVIDETGAEISSDKSVTVKYQHRANDAIKNNIDIYPIALHRLSETPSVSSELVEKYFYAYTALYKANGTTKQCDANALLYAVTDTNILIVSDPDYIDLETSGVQGTALVEMRDEAKVYLRDDLWEQQDDEYNSDIQLTAAYYAMSMLADMVPTPDGAVKMLYDRYRFRFKDLKNRYNSAKFNNVTIKPCGF